MGVNFSQTQLATALRDLGDISRQAKDLDEAKKLFERSEELRRARLDRKPDDPEAMRELGVILNSKAGLAMEEGRMDEAIRLAEDDLALRRRLLERMRADATAVRDVGTACWRLGNYLRLRQAKPSQRGRALELANEALTIAEQRSSSQEREERSQQDAAQACELILVLYASAIDANDRGVPHEKADLAAVVERIGPRVERYASRSEGKDQAITSLLVSNLLEKLGDLHCAIGDLERALACWEAAQRHCPIDERHEDKRRLLSRNLDAARKGEFPCAASEGE